MILYLKDSLYSFPCLPYYCSESFNKAVRFPYSCLALHSLSVLIQKTHHFSLWVLWSLKDWLSSAHVFLCASWTCLVTHGFEPFLWTAQTGFHFSLTGLWSHCPSCLQDTATVLTVITNYAEMAKPARRPFLFKYSRARNIQMNLEQLNVIFSFISHLTTHLFKEAFGNVDLVLFGLDLILFPLTLARPNALSPFSNLRLWTLRRGVLSYVLFSAKCHAHQRT